MANNNATQERYEKALAVLISEPNVRAAAEKMGVSEATMYRYLRDPVLAKAYREARWKMVESAAAKLCKSVTTAVDRLIYLLEDSEQPGHVHVTAARTVLEYAFKTVEVEQLKQRLEALEAQFKEHDPWTSTSKASLTNSEPLPSKTA